MDSQNFFLTHENADSGPDDRTLVRLGLRHSPETEELIERLEEPDGSEWFQGCLADGLGYSGSVEVQGLLSALRRESLEGLTKLKDAVKNSISLAKDSESRLIGLATYFSALAAAMAYRQATISSQSPSRVGPVLFDLSASLSSPWKELFQRASEFRRAPRRDAFPHTQATWIKSRLEEGESGKALLNHELMNLYQEPLCVYLRGSSFKSLLSNTEDAADFVAGFFASRLSQPHYIDDWHQKWTQDGMRLRRWLINGFVMYCLEEARNRKKAHTAQDPADEELRIHYDSAEKDFDRIYMSTLVRAASAEARQSCSADPRVWQAFLANKSDRIPQRQIAQSMDLPQEKVKGMVRRARQHFRVALRELIRRELGVQDEDAVDAEIREFLALIESS